MVLHQLRPLARSGQTGADGMAVLTEWAGRLQRGSATRAPALRLSASYLRSPQDSGSNGGASSDAQTVLQQLLQAPPTPSLLAAGCELRGKMSSLPSR